MASINYAQTINNSTFYGIQANVQPTFTNFAHDTSCYPIGDLQIPSEVFGDFDNAVFVDETQTITSLSKGSKKIIKSCEGAKKISRKKHNRPRNPWSPKEDAKLVDLMKKYGQSWAMISSLMEGRTGKQIRDRYLNKLRPNIKCGDWSAEEDLLLVRLLSEVGNRWSLIATHLPGRTEGQVKNRYYSCIKKRLQPDGTLSQPTVTRNASEGISSFQTSPEGEENGFDFKFDFDANMMNGCATFANQDLNNSCKGPYVVEEDTYSEESTTQGPISQAESPYRVIDQAPITSYDQVFGQSQSYGSFYIPPIEEENQVDELLNKVTNYFTEKSSASDVDSYFSDDLRSDKKRFTPFVSMESNENDRLSQLTKRKAFLELALAKTLKEIKGL